MVFEVSGFDVKGAQPALLTLEIVEERHSQGTQEASRG
jgi:hypothetical protein